MKKEKKISNAFLRNMTVALILDWFFFLRDDLELDRKIEMRRKNRIENERKKIENEINKTVDQMQWNVTANDLTVRAAIQDVYST